MQNGHPTPFVTTSSAILCLMYSVGTAAPQTSQTGPCSPNSYEPEPPAAEACVWEYHTDVVTSFTELLWSTDTDKYGVWDPLPTCACGWYARTQPCPPCEADQISTSVADVLQWTTSSQVSNELALELKAELIAEIGFTYG